MANNNPFNGLLTGNRAVNPKMEGYVSPFSSLDVSKWKDAPIKKAPPAPKKKDTVDKILDFGNNNPVGKFLNAAGERFGGNLVKDTLAIPKIAKFAKPVLPHSADIKLDQVLAQYDKAVKPATRTSQLSQNILNKSRAGDTFGTGLTVANDVAQAATGGIEGAASAAKIASKVVTKGGKTAKLIDKAVPWARDTTKVSIKPGETPKGVIDALGDAPTTGEQTPKGLNKFDEKTIDSVPAYQRRTGSNADKPVELINSVKPKDILDTPTYQRKNAIQEVDKVTKDIAHVDDSLSKLPDTKVSTYKYDQKQKLAADIKANPSEKNSLVADYKQRINAVSDFKDLNEYKASLTEQRQALSKQAGKGIAPEPLPALEAKQPAKEAGNLAESIQQVQAPPTRAVRSEVQGPPSDLKPQRPGVLKRIFQSTTGELSSQGSAGRTLADKIHSVRDHSELGQAAFVQKIPTVLKLGQKDFETFADTLDVLAKGKEVHDVPKSVAEAVEEWRNVIPAVRQAAEKAGIEVGDLGEYYFPRDYTKVLSTQSGLESSAKHLVDTGQAKDIGEAMQTIQQIKGSYATRYGHFDQSRKADLPGYDKSKNAIVSYINSAFDRVAHAEQFGPKGEAAHELISQIAKDGGDPARAFRNYSIATGTYKYDQPVLEGFSKGARSFNRLRTLGLSAVLNTGQITNTVTVNGLWNTAKGALKLLTKSERQYVKDTGVILDSVLHGLREQTGIAGKATDKLTAPGFNTVERFNRSVAVEASKQYANGLAKKAAKGNARAEKILRDKLGVEGKIGKKLTDEQAIAAGRKGVELTQFKVDPQDLPGWADSPGGKLVIQLKTFGYKQTKFMYNEVLKEAARGNLLPLTRFLAAGSVIGYGAGSVRGVLRGEGLPNPKEDFKDPKTAAGTLLTALGNVGAFGLASDAKFLASHASSPNLPRYLASTFGGPTAGLAAETAQNISSAARGDTKPITRQVVGDVPIIGPAISNATMPYKPVVNKTNEKILSDVPENKQEAYTKALDSLKNESKNKTKVAEQVKANVKSGDYGKAGRLVDQQNAMIDSKTDELKQQLGELPPDMVDYLNGLKVNYNYYYKKRFDD